MSDWRPRFRNLPLFWKVLVPFLTLMVVVGASGVFLIVSDLSARAQSAVDQEVSARMVDARAFLRERELYLLESANFAANVDGMAAAIGARDKAAMARLLQSVVALKTDLGLVATTDAAGNGLVEFMTIDAGDAAPAAPLARWADHAFVAAAIADGDGGKHAGFLDIAGTAMLGIAAPVCSGAAECAAAGTAVVAVPVDDLARAATGERRGASGRTNGNAAAGVAIFGADGRLLSRSGLAPRDAHFRAPPGDDSSFRRQGQIDSTEVATLFAPLEIQGTRAGTLAVSVPTARTFASVRGAASRLVVIVLAAMIGIVGLGALLSRSILAQVSPLVATHRALGRGDLTARAPVVGDDELGELARGVNQMAEQLQASYETLELRVDQRTEEIRRLLRDRTEFFAGLSHELRTPLAVILTQAEMMTTTMGRRGREATEIIQTSAVQLLGVVNEILDLARAEAGPIDVELESVSLEELLKELQPMVTRLGAAASVAVVLSTASALPPVLADPRRLRDVVVQLVDNAIKYTPPGGRVEIATLMENGTVVISVGDTGVGIPVEVGDRVFEPFYRVNGTRPQRGEPSSGLGLALTRRWVEAQRGTISWRAKPDGGTVFSFTLLPA